MPDDLLAADLGAAARRIVSARYVSKSAAIDAVGDVVADGHAAIYGADDAAAHDAIDGLFAIINALRPAAAAGHAKRPTGRPPAAANAAAAAAEAIRRAGWAVPPDEADGEIAEFAAYHAKEATARAIDAASVDAITAAVGVAATDALDVHEARGSAAEHAAAIDALIAAAAADGYAAGRIDGYAEGYVSGYGKGYTDGSFDAEFGKGWKTDDDDDEDGEFDDGEYDDEDDQPTPTE